MQAELYSKKDAYDFENVKAPITVSAITSVFRVTTAGYFSILLSSSKGAEVYLYSVTSSVRIMGYKVTSPFNMRNTVFLPSGDYKISYGNGVSGDMFSVSITPITGIITVV